MRRPLYAHPIRLMMLNVQGQVEQVDQYMSARGALTLVEDVKRYVGAPLAMRLWIEHVERSAVCPAALKGR